MALIESETRRLALSKRRHHRIDAVTHGEAVGTLFRTIAREIALAHEAAHRIAFAERHFEAARRDFHDFNRDDLALAIFSARDRIALRLLDAEADALFLDIDGRVRGL